MDESRYLLRGFQEGDYGPLATIQSAIHPNEPISAQSLQHIIESFRPLADPYMVVVADRRTGEVVGNGAVFVAPFESDVKNQWIEGGVLPTRQREGIGSSIYDHLVAEARRRGAIALTCRVLESSGSGRGFLAKRDFVERRRSWRSRLDVASADTSRLAPLVQAIRADGIEFTTLAREGAGDLDVLKRLHAFHAVVAKDMPREGAYTPVPFEDFRTFFLEGESFLPDAWYLAKVGDQYVGASTGSRESAQPEVLQQNITGTRPEFRRKKIALALKLMLIDYAKSSGYARIETSNDSLNVPMWTLNQGLGFRKVREQIHLETQLAATPRKPGSAGS